MGINSQVDNLIKEIDFKDITIAQVRESLFDMLTRLGTLNTQLTKERSAMWEVIDNNE